MYFFADISLMTGGYPSYEDYIVGFRVSEVPEPATMSLLVLGGLGMLMRRRVAPRTVRP